MKFPTELDTLDWVTDELKEKLSPVSRRLKEIEKERFERMKVRRRTKAHVPSSDKDKDVEMTDANASTSLDAASSKETEKDEEKGKDVAVAELEEEWVYREKELKELEELVHPDLKADVGCSVNGLYELVGASVPSVSSTTPLTAHLRIKLS